MGRAITTFLLLLVTLSFPGVRYLFWLDAAEIGLRCHSGHSVGWFVILLTAYAGVLYLIVDFSLRLLEKTFWGGEIARAFERLRKKNIRW